MPGPFPAETMQTWHDQQYFTDDLRMKRVDIDREWITVADIKTRSMGERVFLSPLNDVLSPPGLSRLGVGLPRTGIFRDVGLLDSPRQPTPQSFGTPSSHFAAGSASPSSSFGVPAYTGMSSSPDSFVVGGRLGSQNFMGADIHPNGRIPSGAFSSPNANLLHQGPVHEPFFGSRNVGGDMQRSNSASYDGSLNPASTLLNVPWQKPAPTNGWDTQIPTSSPFINHAQVQSNFGAPGQFSGPAATAPVVDTLVNQQSSLSQDPFGPSSDYSQPVHDRNSVSAGLGHAESDHGLNAFTPAALQPLSMPIRTPSLTQKRSDSFVSSPVAPSPSAALAPGQSSARPSPWAVVTPQETRVSPFDIDRPRATNTFVSATKPAAVSQRPVWTKDEATQPPAPVQNAPWVAGSSVNNWGQLSEEPQSLTTANVLKHEEQHKANEALVEQQMQEVKTAVETPTETVAEVFAPTLATPKQQTETHPQQPKRKQSAPAPSSTAKVE